MRLRDEPHEMAVKVGVNRIETLEGLGERETFAVSLLQRKRVAKSRGLEML